VELGQIVAHCFSNVLTRRRRP